MHRAPRTGLLGDATSEVSTIAGTAALPTLAMLLLVSAGAVWWLHRRHQIARPVAWLFALWSVALVVAVTLLRDGWPARFSPSAAITEWSTSGLRLMLDDPLGSSQFVLNVWLLVPAGVAWTLLVARPARVFAALATGVVTVEALQAVLGVGAADIADVVANCLGASLGIAAGAVVMRRGVPLWSRRRQRWAIAAAATALVAAAGAVWLVAEHRQTTVEREARAAFSATTRADVDLWNEQGTMDLEVFDKLSVRADGASYGSEAVRVRYPAFFLGVHRCLFVVWTNDGVAFERASGEACTAFIG